MNAVAENAIENRPVLFGKWLILKVPNLCLKETETEFNFNLKIC